MTGTNECWIEDVGKAIEHVIFCVLKKLVWLVFGVYFMQGKTLKFE